jgi:EamA domain-containing membrane protein RarD
MRDDRNNALLADTAVLFAAASTRGLVSVVSVLSPLSLSLSLSLSLYPVVVALARTVLAERIARAQQAGVVLALAGVALISLG